MNYNNWSIKLTLFCVIILISNVLYSQVIIVPISGQFHNINKHSKKNNIVTTLPFIDDFSGYIGAPNPLFWNDNLSYVNNSFGINPPTLGVITLDATDQNGKLYENASYSSFSADTLTSVTIRLDSIFNPIKKKLAPSDSVYLSFHYQPGGGLTSSLWESIGGIPSKNDSLLLEFFSPDKNLWEHIWSTKGFPLDSIVEKDGKYFRQVLIPITEEKYFHKNFKFRFRNYASLSNNPSYAHISNCDQWNIDYVYLNYNRKYIDTTYDDASFSYPTSSLLKRYQIMPAKQFSSDYMKDYFDATFHNLHNTDKTLIYKCNILDADNNIVQSYPLPGIGNTYPIAPFTSITPQNDLSNFFFSFNKNNWTYFDILHTITNNIGGSIDLVPNNDTIRYRQIFENFFAYDDGTAESGYGLESKINSYVALEFNMNEPDSLSAIDLYFNSTYNNSNIKNFKICIWNEKNGSPNEIIFKSANLLPDVDGLNKFHRYNLDSSIYLTQGNFFIGVETKGTTYLNIGFDQNTDASKYTFVNWDGNWKQPFIKGSVMIRPYFGYKAIDVSLTQKPFKEINFSVYPNPANSFININVDGIYKSSLDIKIINMIGRIVYNSSFKEQIDISKLNTGVYILSVTDKKTNISSQKKIIINK